MSKLRWYARSLWLLAVITFRWHRSLWIGRVTLVLIVLCALSGNLAGAVMFLAVSAVFASSTELSDENKQLRRENRELRAKNQKLRDLAASLLGHPVADVLEPFREPRRRAR